MEDTHPGPVEPGTTVGNWDSVLLGILGESVEHTSATHPVDEAAGP